MSGFLDDVRPSLRSLARSPGFTTVVVVVLGLGIGANTAIFSFLDALLLRPFRFERLDELVTVWETHPQPTRQADAAHAGSGQRNPVSPGDLADLENNRAFLRLAAYRYRDLNLTGVDRPERFRAVLATADFFAVLAVKPILGRTFLPEEETPGKDGVLVLSHSLWKNNYGSDPSALGRTCLLNDRAYTIVGVMPAHFDFPLGGVRLWLPLALTGAETSDRAALSLRVLGRLRPGVGLAQARAEMDGIAARLAHQHPQTNAGRGVALVPLSEQEVGFAPTFALLFQVAAVFVLLITCANIANLLLARAAGRQREVAVRAALGASRGRVVRQLLCESLILSLLGGVFALWLAHLSVTLIRTSLPPDIAKWMAGWSAIDVDARAMAFTLAVAVLTSFLFGAFPARQAARGQLTGLLNEGRGSVSRGSMRLRNLLVVSELTLALVLLVGAGLMVRGFVGLMTAYQGFDPEGVMTFRMSLPERKYPAPLAARLYDGLLERLQAAPAVEAAAIVSQVPGDMGPVPGGTFSIEGRPAPAPNQLPVADFQTISPDYFRALRVPLLSGRGFEDADGADAPAVAIISESVARRFWAGEDPLGDRIKVGPPEAGGAWMRIVGVARDVRQYWFDEEPRLTLYFPYRQSVRRNMCVLVRTAGDVYAMAALARGQLRALDRDQPIYEVLTLAEVIRQAAAFVRIAAALMVVLGALALVLAALGVYGVVAHSVSQRIHEMGVRLAVGARPREIVTLVVGRALKMAVLGLAIGLPLALALSRVLSSRLFGLVRPDPLGLLAVVLGLAGVAAAASYFPARRAAAVNPVITLRGE